MATHRLADADERTPAFHAAVRLARWLAGNSAVGAASLQALLGRHGDSDAWVDSAVNDAAPGVSDPDLGAGLAAVLAAVRARRAAHDTAFAAALAAHTSDDPGAVSGTHAGVRHLEDLLPTVVLPLARSAPVLLLVLDGMSAGVGTEVITSVLARAGDGWAEALLPGQNRRAAALAVLPTLTEVSRASLLCGELRTGGQDIERRGYDALTRAHGLPGAALFHKKPLDSSRPGFAVADDVAAAIADVTGQPLVTCVLNTIDDALDRSDPGGTDWGADAVKHLAPLLDRARHAGRIVVLTADHGHVVERRQGTQRAVPRHLQRPVPGGDRARRRRGGAGRRPAGAAARRAGRARRGRAPAVRAAEGRLPRRRPPRPRPSSRSPCWCPARSPRTSACTWRRRRSRPGGSTRSRLPPRPRRRRPLPPRRGVPPPTTAGVRQDTAPTLFDEPDAEPAQPPGPETQHQVVQRSPVPAAVLKSAAYAAQKKIAGRVSVTDDQIRGLLDALVAAPGHRLVPAQAAAALAVSPVMLRGAVLHVQRLLNVEGYPVLRVDADGSTVVLDEALLREQFGIRA